MPRKRGKKIVLASDPETPVPKRAKFEFDPSRLPDEVLLEIFKRVPDVRNRMRLCQVSKRFRKLIYSKAAWDDFDVFDMNWIGDQAELNGCYVMQRAKQAAQFLFDRISPVSCFCLRMQSGRVAELNRFHRRVQNAQQSSAANAKSLQKFHFQGSMRYLEFITKFIDQYSATLIDIYLEIETLGYKTTRRDVDVEGVESAADGIEQLWTAVSKCDRLYSFEFYLSETPRPFSALLEQFITESAVQALSGKEELDKLKVTTNVSVPRCPNLRGRMAAIAKSCPLMNAGRVAEGPTG